MKPKKFKKDVEEKVLKDIEELKEDLEDFLDAPTISEEVKKEIEVEVTDLKVKENFFLGICPITGKKLYRK
jgi:hypothetical protein